MRLPLAAACLFALTAYAVDAGHVLRGYTPEDSVTEVSWEQKFRALPDADRIRENMRRLSARPHHVGSPYDHDNAEWLLAQLKSDGLDAQIEECSALFPTPKSRTLELLGPEPFTAKLQEPPIGVDPRTAYTTATDVVDNAMPAISLPCSDQCNTTSAKPHAATQGARKPTPPITRLGFRKRRNDRGSISAPARNVSSTEPNPARKSIH